MLRRVLVFALAIAPIAIFVACADSNGDALPSPLREAGTLEAGNGSPDPQDSGGHDASRDADRDAASPKDAARDGDAETGAPPPALLIEEVFLSDNGDAREYVELRGAPDAPLAGFKLRLIDETGKVAHEVEIADATDKIPASGRWVVGGGLANTDHVLLPSMWGLDNDRGAVQLVSGPANTLIDVVGYTTEPDAGAVPAPSTDPKATSEGAIVVAQVGRAFGRENGAADTNDNKADFCKMAPTPRAAQAACDP